ncbi:MAG: 16S rRNA (cytosine(1402)-N(4))-methyltransferase RsmH [Bacillales bacterium]|nr:16S rRNA (cytosine(1402)-N(4))-methyltransferase RsmH [Bacillales bacterium]
MHISVLLEESIKYLNLKSDSKIIDCTLGYGGHSSEILKRIPNGFLYSFDQDKEAIKYSDERLKKIGTNYKIINSNFVNLKENINEEVDGILYDLGVSSPQLDTDYRGFSFHSNARLDMRMNQDSKLDAYKVVNEYSYEKLRDIFYKYGEEKFSNSIAKKIVEEREKKKIETTLELVEIIKSAVPDKYKREHHPARKIFQAIRIEVNDELDVLKKSLTDALDLIKVGGRICVITFHSLEDKIVKDIFKENSTMDNSLKKLPIVPEELLPKYKLVKTLEPTEDEILNNKRARSAKLRVIERVR